MKLISTAIALSLMMFSAACDDDNDLFKDFDQTVEVTKGETASESCKSLESKDHCGGNADGEWKLKEICGGAAQFDGMVSSIAGFFPCEVEGRYHGKLANEMQISGDAYSDATAFEVQVDLTFHSDCFANSDMNVSSCSELAELQDDDGSRAFDSCSGSNSACICRMSMSEKMTESGNLEIDGSHISIKPTQSSDGELEDEEGDFCVNGDQLLYWSDGVLMVYTR